MSFSSFLADDLEYARGDHAELHRLARATLGAAGAGQPGGRGGLGDGTRALWQRPCPAPASTYPADFDAHRMLARVAGRAPVDEQAVRTRDRGTQRCCARPRTSAKADGIREQLLGLGVQLKDAKDPVTGEIRTTWELSIPEAAEVER